MSTTEHDLDASALDAAVEEVEGVEGVESVESQVAEIESDIDVDVGSDVVGVAVDHDGHAELDEPDDASDRVDDRLGRYDDFLVEAQAEHADDGADDSAAYVLPAIVMATESDDDEADLDDARARRHEEPDPEVPDDVLEELRRADIDGPTVPVLPHDVTSGRRRAVRSPEYDPAPMPIALDVPLVLGRKPRVRRVTRVVRHVDPWSVFKIAIVANLLIFVILMVAGVLLWNVANATGTVDNVERFFESFGWASFEFNGGELYHSAWTGGLFLVIGFTGLAVLLATMFNLITDLVGGVRFTVLEEEVVETRSSPMRRFVVRRPEPVVPLVSQDASGPVIREAVVDDSPGTTV